MIDETLHQETSYPSALPRQTAWDLPACLGVLVVLMYITITSGLYWAYGHLPDMRTLSRVGLDPLAATSRLEAADGSLLTAGKPFAHIPVPLAAISVPLQQTLLAVSDARFTASDKTDPLQLFRLSWNHRDTTNLPLSLRVARLMEATTAADTHPAPLTEMFSAMRLALLAIRLENTLPKPDLLALYLNRLDFGEGAYGVEAASRVYFNKAASQIDMGEAATLAGLLADPLLGDPYFFPDRAAAQRNRILQQLAQKRVLAPTEAATLSQMPLRLDATRRVFALADPRADFNHLALQEALGLLHMDEKTFWQQGYRVQTTLDPRFQRQAEQQLQPLPSDDQATLMTLDRRNRILAYVGHNSTPETAHPMGAMVQPLIAATALQLGFSPQDRYTDPATHRTLTMAQTLESANAGASGQILKTTGPAALVKNTWDFGIQSVQSPLTASMALATGNIPVSLRELTVAYSVFRNQGQAMAPYAVAKILDSQGQVLYEHPVKTQVVLTRPARDTLVAMLQTSQLKQFSPSRFNAAGFSDRHWFVGFTLDVTTGLWLQRSTSMYRPAALWHVYMAALPLQPAAFDLAQAMPMTVSSVKPMASLTSSADTLPTSVPKPRPAKARSLRVTGRLARKARLARTPQAVRHQARPPMLAENNCCIDPQPVMFNRITAFRQADEAPPRAPTTPGWRRLKRLLKRSWRRIKDEFN